MGVVAASVGRPASPFVGSGARVGREVEGRGSRAPKALRVNRTAPVLLGNQRARWVPANGAVPWRTPRGGDTNAAPSANRFTMNLLRALLETLLRPLSGGLGRALRALYYRTRLRSAGLNLVIDEGVFIAGAEQISLGHNVWIDKGCVLVAGPPSAEGQRATRDPAKRRADGLGEAAPLGVLTIGDHCHLGMGTVIQAHGGVVLGRSVTTSAGVKLFSWSNDARRSRAGTFGPGPHAYVRSPIVVEDNVWLGLDAVVLGGRLGADSFVMPKSVVVDSFPANSWMGGNPAERRGPRFPADGSSPAEADAANGAHAGGEAPEGAAP